MKETIFKPCKSVVEDFYWLEKKIIIDWLTGNLSHKRNFLYDESLCILKPSNMVHLGIAIFDKRNMDQNSSNWMDLTDSLKSII